MSRSNRIPLMRAARWVAPAALAVRAGAANENLFDLSRMPLVAQQATTAMAAPQEAPASDAPVASSGGYGLSERATFLLSNEYALPTLQDPWEGFLSGMRGFEHFYEPVGSPLYFESPFVNTSLRFLYLHHDFPNEGQIGGGNLNVYAVQARVALSERLAFIATKDGYSDLNAGILPAEEGWNDAAVGLKYAFLVDRENDFVMTGGLRWEWENGDREVLMGADQELSPFISVAKGWDRFHFIGAVNGRIPTDQNDGNNILSWDLHFDYDIAPETLPGFAPIFEVHGLHYLSDGERLPLSIGGLDYTNLGSTNVAGSAVIWGGIGFRWKLTPHWSVGSTWEFPFHSPDDDIMGNRVTVDMILSW